MILEELYSLIPAEKLTEVKELLEEHRKVTPETLKDFLAISENEKYIAPIIDRNVTRGISSYQENFDRDKLPGIIEAEIKKRFPDADPKDTALAEMQSKIDKMQKDGERKELMNLVLKETSGKLYSGFPVASLIGGNEEETKGNIESALKSFSEYFKPFEELKAKAELKTPAPGKNLKAPEKSFAEMSLTERTELYKTNPDAYNNLKG